MPDYEPRMRRPVRLRGICIKPGRLADGTQHPQIVVAMPVPATTRDVADSMTMRALECAHVGCRMYGVAKLTAERFPVCNVCERPLSNPEPATTDCGSPDMNAKASADPRVS